jgi:Kyakuja-Dileera-Zisupton transposase
MSCTHGHVVRCANLFKGETYKHTHDQHLESLRLGAKFFCNDVICKYWPFAVNVAKKFPERPEFSDAVTKQHWFLSRFHGRAHSWDCRVSVTNVIHLFYI